MKQVLMSFLFAVLVFASCKKEDKKQVSQSQTAHGYNNVLLNFTNVAGNTIAQFSPDEAYNVTTPKYINAAGDTFSVISFMYYVSNIKLKRSNGTYYVQPNSYYLIDAADSITCKIDLSSVPAGEYTSIEFMHGIDSITNFGGAQSGDLDPSHGMYWSWNQGYIFTRFFGYSSSAPANSSHNLTFEIGGATNFNMISLSFSSPLVVTQSKSGKIFLKTDVLECFKNPNAIAFDMINEVMLPKDSAPFVQNFADIFSVAAVQ